MPRRATDTFRCPPLGELCEQLLSYAPADKRAAQSRRAEKLHDQIDPDATYPLDFIVYRITHYRRKHGESLLLVGEAVLEDLRLLIDRLSKSVNLPLNGEEGEQVETLEQLAERLDVSTKTIRRWRKAGLRWRWVTPDGDSRKRLAFTRQAVEHFTGAHRERVRKASQFTQIQPGDRRRLLDRARRLAAERDVSLNQVAAHLAKRTDRALETMRQLLETHDRNHPEAAIFAERGPLSPRDKRIIARAFRMHVPVSKIARRFGRSRATIYRVVHDRRAAAARRLPLNYVASPTFTRPDADEVILRDAPDPYPSDQERAVLPVPVNDLPEPLRPLYRQPRIENSRLRSLFVRFNYLKYRATKIRDHLHPYHPRAKALDEFEASVRQAAQLRDLLVKANLPIVLSVARRHLINQADRSTHRLLNLLELGVPVLIEAVEAYHAGRSQQFESFLTNRLMQHYTAFSGSSAQDRGGVARGGRAVRRISAEQLLHRLVNTAHKSGVHLQQPAEHAPADRASEDTPR